MIIGIPREIKPQETRVGLTPKWVKKLVEQGHVVLAEKALGLNAGISDDDYIGCGAEVVDTVEELYSRAEFIVKLKDFTNEEARKLPFRQNQIIMTFFHLGENDPHQDVVNKLLEKRIKGIALELIRDDDGIRTVIKPMSEIAGQLAVLVAAHYSQTYNGGRGIHFMQMEGIKRPKALVLGGGSSGKAVIKSAQALGMEVVVLQRLGKTFDALKAMFPNISVREWDQETCAKEMQDADVLINCIYPLVGMKTPLITREMLRNMKPKTVLVDLAGCDIIETWRFTKISDPVFWEEGILHYGVDNMPALVPETACEAFSASIFKYVEAIASKGIKQACLEDNALKRGVCFFDGKIVDKDVAETHQMECYSLDWQTIEE